MTVSFSNQVAVYGQTTSDRVPKLSKVDQKPQGPKELPGMDWQSALQNAARSVTQSERQLSVSLGRLRQGRVPGGAELLALQAGIYRYAHEVQLMSKLVDKGTGAIRQLTQSSGA